MPLLLRLEVAPDQRVSTEPFCELPIVLVVQVPPLPLMPTWRLLMLLSRSIAGSPCTTACTCA